jgi:UDP-N-acetylglucosamine--N-acetylmuramyl-(pentapeptide) pyrophosphoryl-undecaprenol N-acetylglucosamine transferase
VRVVVTGGGTSGHVVPALAILESLVDAGIDPAELRYVGSRRGVETRLVPPSGIGAEFLPMAGLQRSFAPRRVAANLLLPWRVLVSRRAARALVRIWRPAVVVSVGGYASDPMAQAAVAAGVPLVCVSYDRRPGLATRRQARHAAVCASAFPDSGLPGAQVTGAPVRRAVRTLDRAARRAAARAERGIPLDALVLAVTGGSLGSAALNAFVDDVVAAMGERPAPPGGWVILHSCGPRYASAPPPPTPTGVRLQRTAYEERMEDVYAACDLLVARAGASTVAEVSAAGVPCVLVPWSGAAGGHQEMNARWLGDAGGAVLLSDAEVPGAEAVRTVLDILVDSERLEGLARAARAAGEMHRGDALVRLVLDASS